MEWYQSGALVVGLLLVFMALSIPVAIAFFAVSIIGMLVFIGGEAGLAQIAANVTSSVTLFVFVPIPLFLLMGELFFHTGLAVRVFDAFDALFGRLPGRLSYLTVAGGTVFAALTGTSMGSTAMLGALMVPEMTRRGYKRYMSMGPILGTGGLAIIIPPSGLAVLLGSIAKIDIGKLLIAGVLPGLILALLYAAMIYLQVRLDPDAAPHYDVETVPWRTRLRLLATHLLPMGVVIFMVIGLMILGVATPSESAAFGVLGVLILAVAFRSLTLQAIVASLRGALRVTAMVLFVVMASSTFSQILAISGATSGLTAWVASVDAAPLLVLVAMFLILLTMGMLMDQVSIMLITIPIFFPLAQSLGFDLIWFAIVMLLALEISGVTPPFGLGLFVMLGVAPRGTTLWEVARAAVPFVGCDLVLFALLIAFPPIAVYLPGLMS
ncbi:MAG: TRAP transporter large permease [Defluviicoccus sp.]|nr:TRAP transporter large permease [Defluviicoccus sp.]